LQECKELKESLKTFGFVWKRFANEYDSRHTIYQMKRAAGFIGRRDKEPLVCQVARVAGDRQQHTLTSEELILGYYCKNLGGLVQCNEVQGALSNLLSKVKLTALRYQVTDS